MGDLGPHAGFIVGAYAATVVVLGSLIGWIVGDARRQNRLLTELEARGVTRRSTRTRKTASGKTKGRRR